MGDPFAGLTPMSHAIEQTADGIVEFVALTPRVGGIGVVGSCVAGCESHFLPLEDVHFDVAALSLKVPASLAVKLQVKS